MRQRVVDPFSILPYHELVAAQRRNQNKTFKGSRAVVIFWLVFIIVIITIFFVNAETIQRNFGVFITRMTAPSDREEDPLILDDDPLLSDLVEIVIEPALPLTEPLPQIVEPVVTPPAITPEIPPTTAPAPETTPAVTQPTPPPPPPVQPPPMPEPPPVQIRDRSIFFTQVSSDGQILQSRVTRRIPLSQTPMQDVLNALLAGPTAAELNRGIINFIPSNTRMLHATVRGNTAYINLSEDFLFNIFGVEGYIAQLRQIVWTVTEFSNINDVQIIIEGRPMNYLGEGIWIGSPIGRQSF